MADVFLTRGGPYRFHANCLMKSSVYDMTPNVSPSRIAGEYQHGFFTIGNSFNPLMSVGQADALSEANTTVGEFISLAMVPEHHTVLDLAVNIVPAQASAGRIQNANSDGMTITPVARIYNGTTGVYESDVALATTFSPISVSTASFARTPVAAVGGYDVPTDKLVLIGFVVNSLPTDTNVRLADLTSRIEITAHALDYEVPMHI